MLNGSFRRSVILRGTVWQNMNSASELVQLAHMIRLGADDARLIPGLPNEAAGRLLELARQIDAIADEFDTLAAQVGAARQANGRTAGRP